MLILTHGLAPINKTPGDLSIESLSPQTLNAINTNAAANHHLSIGERNFVRGESRSIGQMK